jgi:hypothetical protein
MFLGYLDIGNREGEREGEFPSRSEEDKQRVTRYRERESFQPRESEKDRQEKERS